MNVFNSTAKLIKCFAHLASQVNSQWPRGSEDDHEYLPAENLRAPNRSANSLTKTFRHAAAAETNVCKTRTRANENIWLNAQESLLYGQQKATKGLTERGRSENFTIRAEKYWWKEYGGAIVILQRSGGSKTLPHKLRRTRGWQHHTVKAALCSRNVCEECDPEDLAKPNTNFSLGMNINP